MPTKIAQIMEALFARASDLSTQAPALPIAWPEPATTFTPPSDGKYLRVEFFPNRPKWQGLAGGKMDHGLLQITVVWPKNQGEIAPVEAAGQVAAHFPKNLQLHNGSTKVKISSEPWISAALREDREVCVPVTILWSA